MSTDTSMLMSEAGAPLELLWLSSPALPVGAFAFSGGIEQLLDCGALDSAAAIETFLDAYVKESLTYWDLPLIKRLHQAAEREDVPEFMRLNELLEAGRESKELLLEEQAIGQALTRLMQTLKLLPAAYQGKDLGYCAAQVLFARCSALACGSPPPAALAVMEAYSFALVQNMLTACCKALPLGQSAAQLILLRLLPQLKAAAALALDLSDEELGCALPFLAIASAKHETQYSRLFRS